MPQQSDTKRPNAALHAAVILACFALAVVVPKAIFASDWYRTNGGQWSIHLRYWIQPAFWALCIGAGTLVLSLIRSSDPATPRPTMGLRIGAARSFKGIGVALLCTVPMLMVGLLSPRESDFSRLFYSTAQAGFFEEWLFRAFAFGLLVQLARFPVWPAAIFTGAVFGLIHLSTYTLEALTNQAGGLAFIGLGGVLYAWLYWRWNWNLWLVIALHTFMNLWWGIWDLDENSLGGWAVWVSRVLTIGAAITITEIARTRPGLGMRLGIHTIDR